MCPGEQLCSQGSSCVARGAVVWPWGSTCRARAAEIVVLEHLDTSKCCPGAAGQVEMSSGAAGYVAMSSGSSCMRRNDVAEQQQVKISSWGLSH